MKNEYTCPCCGFCHLSCNPYRDLPAPPWKERKEPPYENEYGMPSYDVCDCCGFEFGNDDNPGTAEGVSFETYRADWIRDGANWFNQKLKPKVWSLNNQLLHSGIISNVASEP